MKKLNYFEKLLVVLVLISAVSCSRVTFDDKGDIIYTTKVNSVLKTLEPNAYFESGSSAFEYGCWGHSPGVAVQADTSVLNSLRSVEHRWRVLDSSDQEVISVPYTESSASVSSVGVIGTGERPIFYADTGYDACTSTPLSKRFDGAFKVCHKVKESLTGLESVEKCIDANIGEPAIPYSCPAPMPSPSCFLQQM